MSRLIATVLLLASVSGCWFGNDEIRRRLETGSTPAVVIPDGLDKPVFVNDMPIPEVDDPRGLADQKFTIDLPEALSTTFDVQKIVIRRLGEERWIFLDIPVPSVWPHAVNFWDQNSLTIASADPSSGVILTEWLLADNSEGEAAFESLKLSNFLPSSKTRRHKLQLRIEPGVRSGSTEIHLEQHTESINSPVEHVDWDRVSTDDALEAAIIKALAYYLGENITDEQTISLMAAGMEESRTELVPDRVKPVLKYRLDFNRAWQTINAALENANVDIEDLNRSEAFFDVYYTTDHQTKKGFFSRLLAGDKKPEPGEKNRYQVRLIASDDEVHVSVFKDASTPADAEISEQLLKIIREYST
jgi:outer membrane protein assembly factor BamC